MIDELKKAFMHSWTGGASGMPGAYHRPGAFDNFRFADLFDNRKWTKQPMVDPHTGQPMLNRAGDTIYTKYYKDEGYDGNPAVLSDTISRPTTIKRVTKEDDKGVTVTTTETSDVPSVPNYYGKPGQMQHSVYQSPIRNVPWQYSAEEARSDVSPVPRTRFQREGTLDPLRNKILPRTGGRVGGRPYDPPPYTSRFVPWQHSAEEARFDVAPVPRTRFPREANLNSGRQFREESFVHPLLPVLDAIIPPASADLSSESLLADQHTMGMETAPRFEYVPEPGEMPIQRDQYGNIYNYSMTDAQRDLVNEMRLRQQFDEAEKRDDSDLNLSEMLKGLLKYFGVD